MALMEAGVGWKAESWAIEHSAALALSILMFCKLKTRSKYWGSVRPTPCAKWDQLSRSSSRLRIYSIAFSRYTPRRLMVLLILRSGSGTTQTLITWEIA